MPDSSGELYKLILETANEGIWMIDENNLTNFVNDKMAHMIGYSREDMMGKTLFEFMDDEGVRISEQNIEKRKSGIEEVHAFKLMSKNGIPVWTLMNTSPIIVDGEYKGALAMVTDITEQKKQDERFRENYQSYFSLFEESPVPIWDEDFSKIKLYIDELKERGITDFHKYFEGHPDEIVKCASLMIVNNVNQAVVDINEADSKEHVLNHFRELITKDSAGYAVNELVAIANGERSCEFDAELRTFKGNKRYVHLKWTVVKGYEDSYKHVYLTTTDWTEKIIQNNLELQKSNREKETLLKEIHHRVKNNLQIISSLLNLQAGSIEDEHTKELLYVSLNRVHSMALVHELLYSSKNFSSIDYSKYLDALIRPLVNLMSEPGSSNELKLNANGIELNINTALPLGLLINEIVTNSLKHGLKGRPEGLIYVDLEKKDKDNYLLEIGDNGLGISPDVFSENRNSLGVQLIKSLVDQLSGTLELDYSKEGTHYQITFKEIPERMP